MKDHRTQQAKGMFLLSLLLIFAVQLFSPSSGEKKKENPSILETTKSFFEEAVKSANSSQFQLSGEKATYHFGTHGAKVTNVVLKDHKNQTGNPLVLHSRSTGLDIELKDKQGATTRTSQLDFHGVMDSHANRIVFTHAKGSTREIQLTYEVKNNVLTLRINIGTAWDGDGIAHLREVTELQNQEKYIDRARKQTYLYYGQKNGAYNYTSGGGSMFGGNKMRDLALNDTAYISLSTPYFLQGIITNATGIKSVVNLETELASPTVLKKAVVQMAFPTKTFQKGHTLVYYFGENTLQALKKVNEVCTQKINFENNFSIAYRWYFPFFGMANIYIVAPLFNMLHTATNSPLTALFLLLLLMLLLMTFLGYFSYIHKVKMDGVKPFIAEIKAKRGSSDRVLESVLYKKLGINPLVLLLNMLITITFAITTITFLRHHIVFRRLRLFWVSDISSHDGLLHLPFSLPILGRYITGMGIFSLVLTLLLREKTPLETTSDIDTNEVTQSMKKTMKYLFPLLSFCYINTCSMVIAISRIFYTLHTPIKKILFNRFVNKDKINRYITKKIEEVKKEHKPTTSRAMSRLERRMNQ